ncbi:MAG: hypothetical protein ACN6OP_23315, partial [Pseudomonadales bacterium]
RLGLPAQARAAAGAAGVDDAAAVAASAIDDSSTKDIAVPLSEWRCSLLTPHRISSPLRAISAE